jgi:non-heme chloroperoxidase
VLGGDPVGTQVRVAEVPLLIACGESDHQAPWAIAKATYRQQSVNPGVTEIVQIPGRGHSLTIDAGWKDVAQLSLDFVSRFVR